ncbi:MAG: hypothetical protein AAF492_17705, partial [Verrucomicrobiota bacterium]
MSEQTDSKQTRIPESLAGQIGQFENRLKNMETLITIFGGLCGVMLTYGLLFLSDRVWDTPAWLRIPLTLLGGVALAAFVYYWLTRWLWRRRDTRELARLIQKHHRKLGDRLLGAVELAEGKNLPDNISPELCAAAIKQVTQESSSFDFRDAVEVRRPRMLSMAFGALAMMVLAVFLWAPEAGWNALKRWAQPFSHVDRYTFVSLEDLDPSMDVPHGEPFEVRIKLDENTKWTPESAMCWIENQPKIKTTIEEGGAVFAIPGQTHQGYLNLRVGDVNRRV